MIKCMACDKPILRRYYKKDYDGKTIVLCPECNKNWDELKAKLDEYFAFKALDDEEDQEVEK